MSEMLERLFNLKDQINKLQEEFDALRLQLFAVAVPPGQKSGKLRCGNIVAKFAARENVTWDQAKLGEARKLLGESRFFQFFTIAYKPDGRALQNAPDDIAAMAEWASTRKPGTPAVEFVEASAEGEATC